MKEGEEMGLTWSEVKAKAQDRVQWRGLIAPLCSSQDEDME